MSEPASSADRSVAARLTRAASLARSDVAAAKQELRHLLRAADLNSAQHSVVSGLVEAMVATSDAGDIVRVAVLGDYTLEPVATAARCALLSEGVLADVYQAPYAASLQEILSPGSALYAFQPNLVLIASGLAALSSLPPRPLEEAEVGAALDREVERWRNLWEILGSRLGCPVIQHLLETPEEEYLGIAERRAAWSPGRFVRALNERLVDAAPGFVRWLDVEQLAARVGRHNWRDPRLAHHGKIGFSLRFVPDYALLVAAAWRSASGKTKKALVVDLDNTLWGGVIGDDGLDGIALGPGSAEGEAYESFCGYLKALGQRGVILCVCSKNEATLAAEVFDRHAHMPLKRDELSVFMCNWDDKATNLRRIAAELNIDVSALVFVDDNPAECELVRQSLPEVRVIEMNGDAAGFSRRIDRLHLFDSTAFSAEDLRRGESYQARAKSTALRESATDLDSYLASLEMRAQVRQASPADLTRLAQMEQKTNQFNLTTRRRSLEELRSTAEAADSLVLAVSLVDRFADHGLVAYLAAKFEGEVCRISDWLMSCRVFGRTLEQFTLLQLIEDARARGASTIEAQLVPTPKNRVIENLLQTLGFDCVGTAPGGPWRYSLSGHRPVLKTFIVA
jgi:FkbH-like protein